MRRTILLLTATFICTGCGDSIFNNDFRPNATGVEGQITVVIDSALWRGDVGDAVRDHVGGAIETLPAIEPEFDLEATGLTSRAAFEMVQDRKNVLFVGLIDDDATPESQYLSTIFGADSLRQMILGGSPALVARPNNWRRNQLVYYLAAGSPGDLTSSIEQHAEQLRYHFNEITRSRLHMDMFDIGRQRDLEQTLMDRHGFAVHGQHDFFIAIDTTQFVWLRRVLSDTWRSMFVYYEEDGNPENLTAEWIVLARDALTRRYIGGTAGGWIEVDRRRPMTATEINFNDRYAIEFRGLWQMVGEENGRIFPFGMGGPFVSYAFYDEPTRRLYLIDGMVFAPNYSKREFVRQMEVIAYTFRTLEEEQRERI